ncbi:unnamed protein product [Diamesa tonsa]
MSQEVIIRVQTTDGIRRVSALSSNTLKDLYSLVYKALDLTDYGFSLYRERNNTGELRSNSSDTLLKSNLNHGDIVYYKQTAGSSRVSESSTTAEQVIPLKPKSSEDLVDIELFKLNGRIERKKDEKLCRHTNTNRCVHCSALEPYDANYLKEQKIKHLSFHSYLRKMTSGVDRGKFVAFEDINCKIKSGCRDHPVWPRGICSKCQPSAITLNRQTYRHVDNVMFENNGIVDEFLNYWRITGHQRIGFLYGNYELTNDVPLGIRARVTAIYEPPQESTKNSVKLLDDHNETEIQELSVALGMQRVGWIFTDLLNHETIAGKVKHLRGIDTLFLTAKECILAGYFQNLYPNPCRYSSNGFFGSKFVTVCVTGDSENQIHMEGYSVSAQCMALVRDNCLLPTKDAAELGYIRESTDKQYVPDVFFKDKDQYGNEVQKLARPLPVEYLLVDIPTSSPLTPLYTFPARENYFAVENRLIDGHLQDFAALSSYLSKFKTPDFLIAISDFHVLFYLFCLDCFGVKMKTQMAPILEAVKSQNKDEAFEWKSSDTWSTLEHLIANSSSSHGNNSGGASGGGENWTCNHCTFINNNDTTACEICSLPR